MGKSGLLFPKRPTGSPAPKSSPFFTHPSGVSMAKRSMRSKSRESYSTDENVHALFPGKSGWTPHNPDGDYRDRKYVKNVKAQSEAQQQFMDAIEASSVVLALGPAG